LVREVERAVDGQPSSAWPVERRMLLEEIGPVLWRSAPIARSFFKPHGYAGDYRIIEMMYDLEAAAGGDPTQPALVNCLDHFYSTLHSVRGVWERRHRLARLLREQYERRRGTLRVLDVACGGSRYARDFLESAGPDADVRITLIDQDACAVEYVRRQALARWSGRVEAVSLPIARVGELVRDRRFDVVISSGLFDYLDQPTATGYAHLLFECLAPGGVLGITNFHREDPSAFCKDWFGDWQLVLRDESEVRSLFPEVGQTTLDRSGDGSLIMAFCERRESELKGPRGRT
jgi:extracellular factor (EF) 3-hydroxypalmitic acid methyl ester biosynthesis protein